MVASINPRAMAEKFMASPAVKTPEAAYSRTSIRTCVASPPGGGSTVGVSGADAGQGQEVTVNAVTSGGAVGTSGTAAFWAVTDGSSVLYASAAITTPQATTSGNAFTTASAVIDLYGTA